MAKKLVFGNESRAAISRGVNQLADAVRVTLGPRGRNVVIEKRFGAPVMTKDGVTVAREIELSDPIENIGAQMVREVALKMSDFAGDGTTTATVLAQAIFSEGLSALDGNVNSVSLKRGIDKAVEVIVGKRTTDSTGVVTYTGGALDALSIPITDHAMLARVGTISANGDESIGEMIADAMRRVGDDGVISVEESRTMDSELTVVEGMQFARGYVSPYFSTDPVRMEAVLVDPYILVTNRPVSHSDDVKRIMEKCVGKGPLFIIAAKTDGTALTTLLTNQLQTRALQSCAINAPGYGPQQDDALRDIAALTGATFIAQGLQPERLNGVDLEQLGRAKKVVVGADSTTIIVDDSTKDAVAVRVAEIRKHLEKSKTEFETTKLKERLAKLTAGIGVIKVGAPTELEAKEKKDRVEDAAHATRAAKESGIVPGGGVALVRCICALGDYLIEDDSLSADETAGVSIVARCLSRPLRQIVTNCGEDADVIVMKVLGDGYANFGYDAASNRFVDMVDAGIVDPTKVVRHALINAASIAGMMLTTEALISDIPPEPGKFPAGMQGMV